MEWETEGRTLRLRKSRNASLLSLELGPNCCEIDGSKIPHRVSADGLLRIFSLSLGGENGQSFSLFVDLRSAYWFGGAEQLTQAWPINKATSAASAPYVTGDFYKSPFGSVVERYWLSSRGVAITISEESPLWVGFQPNRLELKASIKGSIYEDYDYQECVINMQIWVPINGNQSLKDLHLLMLRNHLGLPKAVPEELLLRKPLWSTWARFKTQLTEEGVVEFARQIADSGLGLSTLAIDDGWALAHGDLTRRIPIKPLSNMSLTLWVHPFFNADSETAKTQSRRMVSDAHGTPLLTQWWNGDGFLLDVTCKENREWFLGRLNQLKEETGADSFKFDAGEAMWLPKQHRLSEHTYPNNYTREYCKMAAEAGRGVEVRVGSRSQNLGLLTRVMDKDSRWGRENGLQSLIPAVLTLSILGYPFVLADMIGGNAYFKEKPSFELYIRWLEASTLLPALQFSIAPWDYGEEAMRIAAEMAEIRRHFEDTIVKLAKESMENGSPIVRPMWWLDQTLSGLWSDSQFLLGENVLVAPVLEESARSRLVFFPTGRWKRFLMDSEPTISGPTTQSISAPLDSLPIFIKDRISK